MPGYVNLITAPANQTASNGQAPRRVLLIVADGLRPDLFDPAVLPTVARLAERGVRFQEHHAAYPSHTRVNVSTLATGVTPGQHGIVANTMLAPFATEDHVIDTSDYRHLDALDRHSNGQALLVPTLGDLLQQRGERLAVAGTGSGGSNLLWNRHDRGRLLNLNSTYGLADLYDLREKLGEVPPLARGPQVERLRYATRAVTDLFLDDPRNRAIVLWLSEPDSSQHYFGLGSPEATAALRAVDACVADLLDALDRRGQRDRFDIFFLSDHGHSTVSAHQTLREYLALARADLGALPPLATASDYLYAEPGTSEPTTEELAPLVAWLLAQPWVGVVLGGRADLAALPGVIPLASVWNGSVTPRRPLLAVSPRWDSQPNRFGVPGTVRALTTQSALQSSHGSASPYDMHALLSASGPSFQEGVISPLPTGATDLLPTILTLLGLPVAPHLDGRILWEALREPAGEPGRVATETVEPATPAPGAPPARLILHRVGETTYLHGAWQPDATYPAPPVNARGVAPAGSTTP